MSNLTGRRSLYVMVVNTVFPDGSILLDAEQVQVDFGGGPNPGPVPESQRQVMAKVDRDYVSPGSFLYKQIDPDALFVKGDRVAVTEIWNVKPEYRMAPHVYTDADRAKFVVDPMPYYEKGPDPLTFNVEFRVIGRYRGAGMNADTGEFGINV